MDTLPDDLHSLIKNLTSIDVWILLGLSNDNNTRYLEEITPRRRMKLALKEQHAGWINYYLATITSRQWDYIDIDYVIKYHINIIGVNNIKEYICCKIAKYYNRGSYNSADPEWNLMMLIYKKSVIHGLIKGNHIELFEQFVGIRQTDDEHIKFCGHTLSEQHFATTLKHIASDASINMILDFKDQNYTIKILNSVWNDIKLKCKYALFDLACRKKKYQVVEFLSQGLELNVNHIFPTSIIINLIMDGKSHYLNGFIGKIDGALEHYIALACSLSNVEMLDFLFIHSNNRDRFFHILGHNYINNEIFEYYKRKYKTHYSSEIPEQSQFRMMDISKYNNLIALLKRYKPITFDLMRSTLGYIPIGSVVHTICYHILVNLFKSGNLSAVKTFLKDLLSNCNNSIIVDVFLKCVIDSHERLIVSNSYTPFIISQISTYINFNDEQLKSELQKFKLEVSSEATRIELLSLLIDNLY